VWPCLANTPSLQNSTHNVLCVERERETESENGRLCMREKAQEKKGAMGKGNCRKRNIKTQRKIEVNNSARP